MTSPVSRYALASTPLALAAALFAAFNPSTAISQEKPLAPVVVTATRSSQIATEVLADNVVISSEEIAKSGRTSLVDLLQRQRGIEVTRNGGPGANASVFIRGTDNRQNIVLIDGVRVGSSTNGGAAWSAIPLSQIDHVEIVYGPLSTMYGADAVGGVIQIFTKQGDGAPAPTVSAGAGSYGTYNAEAGISGSSEGFRYALRAAHEESDGFSAKSRGFGFNPDKDGYKNDSASGQLAYQFTKGNELGANFLNSRVKSQFDTSPNFDDRMDARVATVGAYLKNQILPNWTSHVQVAQSDDNSTSTDAFSVSFFDTTQKQISWQNNFAVRGSDVLQLLLEQRKEEVDSSTVALGRTRSTNSLAAAYQLHAGAHLAALSLRNDDNSQFGTHNTGSVSYGYRMTNALRANASYGTSFRAPTFNELYFPGFGVASNRPEEGKNTEVGLHYEDGKTQYSAVYFHNRLTDLLVNLPAPCPVEPATHVFGCAFNVNKALIEGVSLGASTALGNFTVRGSLDLQDPKDETTKLQLARRAKKHGTLGLEYNAGMLSTGGELIFSGERFDDAANRTRVAGYGVVNLYANYAFAPNWSLFGRWNNVLDKQYELVKNYNTADSNVFVGVRYGMR